MNETKIKICGLRTPGDVDLVNRYHPDYAGFICCSRFWRFVPGETLKELKERLDPEIPGIGVFVDDDPELVSSYVKEGLIDLIQLHGMEDEDYIERLRYMTGDVKIIKAFTVRSGEDIDAAKKSTADLVLLDSKAGSGETFDWKLIRDVGRDFFLAGGLNPENLKEAIEKYHPYAVDISSGVETDRHKDADKVRRVIEEARKIY